MERQFLGEAAQKFTVQVRGQNKTAPMTRMQAEMYLTTLLESEQSFASIVPCNDSGNQLLLG